jgi:hypothetical protein
MSQFWVSLKLSSAEWRRLGRTLRPKRTKPPCYSTKLIICLFNEHRRRRTYDSPPMGRTMIRAAIIQHTPEIRKNMALADSMVVTAAFMKWPFD